MSIKQFKSYDFKLKQILTLIGISKSRYYYFKEQIEKKREKSGNDKHIICVNKITEDEKTAVIEYALKHTEYRHRELTYRMIDENIAYLSESSVYRVLKEANLIQNKRKIKKYGWIHKYSNYANFPDELWQTDITYLRYNGKEVYQLSFIDVYSRYIVLSVSISNMESRTVSEIFEKYYEKNKNKLRRKPRIQSDNGSCYVGFEFKKLLDKFLIEHDRIHPATPTENVIIERWHRTFKDILYEMSEPKNYEELVEKINKACYYYNYERYHSALGYVTPYEYYRGEPDKIYEERKVKLMKVKEKRKFVNLKVVKSAQPLSYKDLKK